MVLVCSVINGTVIKCLINNLCSVLLVTQSVSDRDALGIILKNINHGLIKREQRDNVIKRYQIFAIYCLIYIYFFF